MSIFSSIFNRNNARPEGQPDGERHQPGPVDNAVEVVMDGLNALQANIVRRQTVNDIEEIDFTFQGGNFSLQVLSDTGQISLIYPSIGEWKLSRLSHIQFLNNRISSTTFGIYLSHRVSSTDDAPVGVVVDIWADLFVSTSPSMEYVFRRLLLTCFAIQRDYISRLDALETNDHTDGYSRRLDEQLYQKVFDYTLVNKLSSDICPPATASITPSLTLGTMIDHLGLFNTPVTFSRLDIFDDDNLERISAADTDIAALPLSKFLAGKNINALLAVTVEGEPAPRALTINVALTRYLKSDDDPQPEGTPIYNFFISLSPAPGIAADAITKNTTIRTFHLPFSAANPNAFAAEASFMMADAIDKIKDDREDELTMSQRVLIELDYTDLDYLIYAGTRQFYNCQYADALFYLDPLARRLLTKVYTLRRNQYESMCHILFITGVAYYTIGNYELSFFFLDPLLRNSNIPWLKAGISTLMATHDFRARAMIESSLDGVMKAQAKRAEENDDEDPDDLEDFKLFLSIHLARFYADDGMLEEAETMARPLLGTKYDTEAAVILNFIKDQSSDETQHS